MAYSVALQYRKLLFRPHYPTWSLSDWLPATEACCLAGDSLGKYVPRWYYCRRSAHLCLGGVYGLWFTTVSARKRPTKRTFSRKNLVTFGSNKPTCPQKNLAFLSPHARAKTSCFLVFFWRERKFLENGPSSQCAETGLPVHTLWSFVA